MKKTTEISRRHFIQTGLGSLFALSGSLILPACSMENQWNVILINVDDLGWTDLGCYGSTYYETPHIDRLASQGMRFTQSYAAASVCSPTRAALMTGRYPARIGITDWIHHLDSEGEQAAAEEKHPRTYVHSSLGSLLCPPNPYWMDRQEVTLAEILKMKGRATGHVGKWHLGYRPWFPDRQGFDFNAGGAEIGQPPSYFDPYYLSERRSGIPTLPPRKNGEYLTDRESDEALSFLRSHRGHSFFLNLWPYAVHTPLQAPPERRARYEAKRPTHHSNPVYAAMIESVDDTVGRVMDWLEETGLDRRTVILFTSDNGGLLGHSTDNRPLRAGKGYPYEGGIRVPLIVRWPGVTDAGSECSSPVCSIDLLPTLCDGLGIPLPDREIDGVSLMPLLRGGENVYRNTLYWHFPHYRARDIGPYSIIRQGDWKLIKWYDGPRMELYNLADDLGESRDRSRDLPHRVISMNRQLEHWLAELEAPVPRPADG